MLIHDRLYFTIGIILLLFRRDFASLSLVGNQAPKENFCSRMDTWLRIYCFLEELGSTLALSFQRFLKCLSLCGDR